MVRIASGRIRENAEEKVVQRKPPRPSLEVLSMGTKCLGKAKCMMTVLDRTQRSRPERDYVEH